MADEDMDIPSSSGGRKGGRKGGVKTKGRGHREANDEGKYDGRDGVFESLGHEGGGGPCPCRFN